MRKISGQAIARAALASVALGSLVCASAARADSGAAQPDARVACPASGEAAKATGDQAMLDENPARALACYEAAYLWKPEPRGLYNRARAHEFLGDYADALRLLREFRNVADPELRARVPQLNELIRSLEARVAGASAASSVEPREPAALAVAVPMSGEAPSALELAGSPAETGTPPAPDTSGGASAAWGWAALGIGSGAAVLAAVSYFMARSAHDDACGGRSSCSTVEYDSEAGDRYDTWRVIFPVSLAAGALGLGAGAFLLWNADADPGSAAGARIHARLTPGGVHVVGSF